MTTASAEDVAEWMAAYLEEEEVLHQDVAADESSERFGKDFVYVNNNGNLGIERSVLRAFRKLTEPNVVWERGERLWRYKLQHEQEDNQRSSD